MLRTAIAAALIFAAVPATAGAPPRIGSHYADALNGIAFRPASGVSYLLRIGWMDGEGHWLRDYRALAAHLREIGPASPDGSVNIIRWESGTSTITFRWGVVDDTTSVGIVSADAPTRIMLEASGAWLPYRPAFEVQGRTIRSIPDIPAAWWVTTDSEPALRACLSSHAGSPEGLVFFDNATHQTGDSTILFAYDIGPGHPLRFTAGYGVMRVVAGIDILLDAALDRYNARRPRAAGAWGDFLAPIANQLNHSKLYNDETGRVAHVVSRGWCEPGGQILFEWDSFFNAVLASLDDSAGAKATFHAILNTAQPDGMIPNYTDINGKVSADRSQPPVGALCAWKLYERWQDSAFLDSVFPALERWHAWWFSPRPSNGLPYRDGNRNGLLEWGTETGVLQNARYESGLDDSPMWDDAVMDSTSRTMMLDAVDLNALWAADALYLAQIADVIGAKEQATRYRAERDTMASRINRLLWDEEIGLYSNRTWSAMKHPTVIPAAAFHTRSGLPGLAMTCYKGMNFESRGISGLSSGVNFHWNVVSPDSAIGLTSYSVRWSGTLTAPVSGFYEFSAWVDDGVRVKLNGRMIIDAWKVSDPESHRSLPVALEAGTAYDLTVEYFQEGGGAGIVLSWVRPDALADRFSHRYAPNNFYPMIAGIPDSAQAARMLGHLSDEARFAGPFVCPTIARNDPAFADQQYWRGKIWAPTNYLLYQGLKRYAPDAMRTDFAQKSVKLFMENWNRSSTCHENYLVTGEGSSDPHYTWGALLCLIGLEELCGVEPDGSLRLNGIGAGDVTLDRFPLGGRQCSVSTKANGTTLRTHNKTISTSRGITKIPLSFLLQEDR
jgi:hypothetical protein